MCLFLIIMISVALFLMSGCRSLPSQHSERAAEQKERHPPLTHPAYVQLEGVDLLATVKGEAHYREERIKFRALLRISSSGKMRFEIYNLFGKMISATIYSQPNISLYIPSMNVLYRGEASPDNMFKLFGLAVEAQQVSNLISGMEPFLILRDQGLFTTIMIQDGTSRKTLLSERELQSLARKGGSLILKDPRDREWNEIEVLSHYKPEAKGKNCFLIVPRENIIDIKDPFMRLKIQLKEIRSYLLHADGDLLCFFQEEGIALEEKDIFSDQPYESMPETELIDLNHIEVDKPLFLRE